MSESDNGPLKKVVEGILHRLVNNDPLYLHEGRYVRWGKVQKDINEAIDILAQSKSTRPEARRTRVDSEMCVMAWNDLREYLLAHEGDIAHGINDFATLAAAFTDVVGRDAETHVMVSQEDGGITQALVKMARESAIEECATVCDAYAREHASGILMSMGESIHGESAGKTLAARIRDLKPRLPQHDAPKEG